ncbi:hypothetical protein Hdeb2414_s0028g00702471 [Helianthus debilis subsp. tardiflorus]
MSIAVAGAATFVNWTPPFVTKSEENKSSILLICTHHFISTNTSLNSPLSFADIGLYSLKIVSFSSSPGPTDPDSVCFLARELGIECESFAHLL